MDVGEKEELRGGAGIMMFPVASRPGTMLTGGRSRGRLVGRGCWFRLQAGPQRRRSEGRLRSTAVAVPQSSRVRGRPQPSRKQQTCRPLARTRQKCGMGLPICDVSYVPKLAGGRQELRGQVGSRAAAVVVGEAPVVGWNGGGFLTVFDFTF